MNTGESLLLIAVCAAIGYGIYKIHQKKKWILTAKIVGALLLVWLILWAVAFLYFWYVERPQPIEKLGQVSLGMTPVDVTLALGKPSDETVSARGKPRYTYTDYSGRTVEYLIDFEDGVVTTVCSQDYGNDYFDLGVYDSEESVIKKLGAPTNTSINKEGLVKAVSYEKYNVSFLISKGRINTVCVTSTGSLNFVEVYGSES